MEVRDVLPRDAIPSVDDPRFGPEYTGDPDDRMLVLEGDPARAYPLRILDYHEIVNDDLAREVGEDRSDVDADHPDVDADHPDVDADHSDTDESHPDADESYSDADDSEAEPVAVTWCPLCGSAVVYERTVGGRTLTFGVSGKLADDDLVMYDRETESEWKQSTGECIAGELAGERLAVRAASTLTWERYRERYPEGVVLQPPGTESEAASDDDTPAPVDYELDPYGEYRAGEGFGLAAHRGEVGEREWNRTDFSPKTVVLGLELDGEAVGFPRPVVEAAGGVVRATVGETDVAVSAVDGELHAFRDPGIEFEAVDGEATLAGAGTRWDPATGEAADGRGLSRLPARRLYAFTWVDDHGPDAFYGGPEG